MMDGYFTKGAHHLNVNVLNREMLYDAMEPVSYTHLLAGTEVRILTPGAISCVPLPINSVRLSPAYRLLITA